MMDVRATGFEISNSGTLRPLAGTNQTAAERADPPPHGAGVIGAVDQHVMAVQASALPMALLIAPTTRIPSAPDAIRAYGAASSVIGTAASMARRVALLPEPGDLALLTSQRPQNPGPCPPLMTSL